MTLTEEKKSNTAPVEDTQHLLQTEMDEINRSLKEITLMLEQSRVEVGKLTQRLIEVVADIGRRNLIRRDVVSQLEGAVPGEVLTVELAANQLGILGEIQHPSGQAHQRIPALHRPRVERCGHPV